MTLDPKPDAKRRASGRPFPWRCPRCLNKEVYPETVPYTAEAAHDGRSYTMEIPDLRIPRCRKCGELVFTFDTDDQIVAALRARLHLLTPEQIKRGRKELELSQKELAERVGVAEATISRWETGALIQSRAMDNLLRLYFALPEVREVLCGAEQDPRLGVDGEGAKPWKPRFRYPPDPGADRAAKAFELN